MSGGAYGFFGKALGLAASFVKSVSAFYVVTKYGFFFSKVWFCSAPSRACPGPSPAW